MKTKSTLIVRIIFWLLLISLLAWLFLIQRNVLTTGGMGLKVDVMVLDAAAKKPIPGATVTTMSPYSTSPHKSVEHDRAVTGANGQASAKFHGGGIIRWQQSYLTGNRTWGYSGSAAINFLLKVRAEGYQDYETNLAGVFGQKVTWSGTPKPVLEHTVLLQASPK
jgi:hypothetical protein